MEVVDALVELVELAHDALDPTLCQLRRGPLTYGCCHAVTLAGISKTGRPVLRITVANLRTERLADTATRAALEPPVAHPPPRVDECEDRIGSSVDDQVAQTQVFYKILEVFDLPVPDDLKSEGLLILAETSGPEFIGGASLGETILRILNIFGAAGAEKAAPVTVANVMYTLIEAGLEAEARQLGLEALLARGF
ncbi:MAG: hypothetical protein IIA70_04210 [Proteobacteria bacterium]|nr:hypothetical protein [Pseudomonadota bacterium]